MKLTIFSDTHIKYFNGTFPKEFIESCNSADMTIGLGDYTCEDFYLYIREISNSYRFVLGNCDDYTLRNYLPVSEKIQIEGYCLFLTHGWGSRDGLEKRIYSSLDYEPDIVLFGHSHSFTDKIIGKTRFINPGSCIKGGSFIEMTLDKKGIQIIKKGL